ncbi:MAG TPA: glycogen debranching N-terminal domain-containing protein, partial [Candidatus Binataceae bacterium]|nr:glycogen debranching N-terminal domain-containing protein [Candidatus Binataceae bacterium]
LPIEFLFAVDFADLFQVRGVKRRRRGEDERPATHADRVRFAYRGIDGVRRTTEIMFKPQPHSLSDSRAVYLLSLRPDERFAIEARVSVCEDSPQARPQRGAGRFDEALESRRAEIARLSEASARVSASNGYLDSLLRRSAADLISIVSKRPEGLYMMAGIPWFATLFGRDSIITAMSTLPFCPELAGGTLRTLAALQGSEVNERRDEQPGKIIHEVRSGEMATTGEVPFGHYYGSIDSTPLFLWLYGHYVASTGDLALAEELWPNVERAIGWIEKWGDRDGDGYVEYMRENTRGLSNQGWKDSVDAISHSDGGLARPPIALCEVQGYVYGAYQSVARIAERLHHAGEADRLRERARALRASFLRDFWLEKEGAVALALDAEKRPCRVMASNAAHCLASGLLDRERAEILARRLMADDMFSGWGVRTLSAKERRYNPMSYHNGSVWPHDNAIAAVGLARLEGREGVQRILDGLLDAAVELKAGSLPELFCGFAREPRLGPVPYPVACHPQAWAAASVFMIVQAMLGLRVKALERRVVVDSPVMPPWLDWLRIDNLSVGDAKVSLMLRRTPISAAVEVMDKRGQVTVEVRK